MSTCRTCDKPTSGSYCSYVCEDMDKLPAPRDDQEKFTKRESYDPNSYRRMYEAEVRRAVQNVIDTYGRDYVTWALTAKDGDTFERTS